MLPPRGPSSAAPGIGDGDRSDSSGNEVEPDSNASLLQSSSQASTEDNAAGSGTKAPGKQKRKRTRYAALLILQGHHLDFPGNRPLQAFSYCSNRITNFIVPTALKTKPF